MSLPPGNLEGGVSPEILAIVYCLHLFGCIIFVVSLFVVFFVSLILALLFAQSKASQTYASSTVLPLLVSSFLRTYLSPTVRQFL